MVSVACPGWAKAWQGETTQTTGQISATNRGQLIPLTREKARQLFPFKNKEKGRAIAPFLFIGLNSIHNQNPPALESEFRLKSAQARVPVRPSKNEGERCANAQN